VLAVVAGKLMVAQIIGVYQAVLAMFYPRVVLALAVQVVLIRLLLVLRLAVVVTEFQAVVVVLRLLLVHLLKQAEMVVRV
jgi:hypothetical protein